MIVIALAISWAGFVAGMGWFYLRTPARRRSAACPPGLPRYYLRAQPRPRNRRTHCLARFLSVSPSLTQPRKPHA